MEKFWADQEVCEIFKEKKPPLNIATGITPSGPIHLGNMREVVIGDVIFKILKEKKFSARLLYVADDFDPLRKLYPFLPKSFEKYIGKPLFKIPCPCGRHKNYAWHFLTPFFASLKKLGISLEIYFASDLYQNGKMAAVVLEALKKTKEIAQILSKVTGRKISSAWSPFHPLCSKCGRLSKAKVAKFDESRVFYQCSCGYQGVSHLSKGEGKLSWRVDWPARWKVLNVKVEPLGKDHAVAGGSWQTGVEISKNIFKYGAPFPIFFEWVHLKGKGAMSSSKGIAFEVGQMLEIAPAEILRYLILRSKPLRHIDFDPSDGLLNLIDEYESLQKVQKTESEKRALKFSQIDKRKIPIISFRQLAVVLQAAQGKFPEIKRLLLQGGQKEVLKDEKELKEQIRKAQNWLENFAPEDLKFSIQKTLPKNLAFSEKQRQLLKKLAEYLSKGKLEAEKLHNFVYETGKKLGLSPKETFQPIYLAILGKDHGPKLGWFLVLLDRKFLIKRLKEVM